MAGDKGSQANPMVAFRDLVRGEAAKISKANDQVILGVVCAVKDGIDIEVQIDGFGSGPIDALWCVPGVQTELGMRVVMNALTGGDKWFVIAIASATTGASGARAYYETPGFTTFVKADFPGLRAITIYMVSGGGGGGGCAATAGGGGDQAAGGGGGGGGGYAEGYVLAKDLEVVCDVEIGAGGAGGAAGNNNGATGGASKFFKGLQGGGTHWVAVNGAGGGSGGAATTTLPNYGANGGAGGSIVSGDLSWQGGGGQVTLLLSQFGSIKALKSGGGGSAFSPPRRQEFTTTAGQHGFDGLPHGQGGGGGVNAKNQSTAKSGGDGSDGLVIVELFF